MYCENFKISSSTWATHFLRMNNITLPPRAHIHKSVRWPTLFCLIFTVCHSFCRELFRPLYGEKRESFLKNDGISFIVVRDPFERLVSAYFDKISKNYTEKSIEWETFGEIQVYIKENYRKIKREGLIPTFEEFAEYVATNTTVLTPRINNHWKPIFYNCAPCIEKYAAVYPKKFLLKPFLW